MWIITAAVVFVVGFGLFRLVTDGRFAQTRRVRGAGPVPISDQDGTAVSLLADTDWSGDLGERATLLQFSSAFCAPCRATRLILTDVAAAEPGVAHIEVDAEHHLALVRRLGVTRTPTTLVLDASGAEVVRATGAPKRDQVIRALDQL